MTQKPISLEGYSIGKEGEPHHFNALTNREDAAIAAKVLDVGDAAFIKRSDLKWTYAIVVEKSIESEGVILRFEVDQDKNRKSFPEKQWGKYIRVIKNNTEAEQKKEDDESTKVSTLSDSLEVIEMSLEVNEKPKPVEEKGWFSGFFGGASQQSHPTVSTNNSLKDSVEMPVEQTLTVKPVEAEQVTTPVEAEQVTTPVEAENVPKDAAAALNGPPEVEEDKGNDAPAEKKKSFFQKLTLSRSSSVQKKSPIIEQKKLVTIEDLKDKATKEWFDPLASEVDYDKNPTDLFQAIEARVWDYARTMAVKETLHFKKDCSTWVVAKGKNKSAPLRFRALPLHGAVVFGAPDDLTKHILEGYPLAARGRDVKGRLPCHLACEHDASDEVLAIIINAFPKAFYIKDKLGKTPLDYINENGNRKWLKQMIPSLINARIEEERSKFSTEKDQALVDFKEQLKSDPEYTKDVLSAVEKASEKRYAHQFEMMELAHKKEIEMLKMKHANETQALLEGFEVKLNFEKKLQNLKNAE